MSGISGHAWLHLIWIAHRSFRLPDVLQCIGSLRVEANIVGQLLQAPASAAIRYAGSSARRHTNCASPSYVGVSSCAGHDLRASRFRDDGVRARLLQADARPLRRREHASISSLLPDNARFTSD
jgi:hypothetical protein